MNEIKMAVKKSGKGYYKRSYQKDGGGVGGIFVEERGKSQLYALGNKKP